MRSFSKLHIDGGDMSGDITPSDPLKTSMTVALAVHLSWTGTGTPAGNIIAQVSMDEDTAEDPSNWVALDTTNYQQAAGGAAGEAVWTIADVAFNWFRVFYDRTSDGTGATLTCRVSGKGF